MTRTKPAEQRRADLLAAGQALFLAKGVAATSLDDITGSAGVSKGLFYLYFRSKEDLVMALRDRFSSEFAERMKAAAAAESDWVAKLDACVRTGFEYYRDLHDLREVLFHHAAPGGQAQESAPENAHETTRETHHAHVAEVIRDILAAGVAAGAFDVPDPEATAVLCYASTHAFDPGFRGTSQPADAQLIAAAQQLFRRAAGVAD